MFDSILLIGKVALSPPSNVVLEFGLVLTVKHKGETMFSFLYKKIASKAAILSLLTVCVPFGGISAYTGPSYGQDCCCEEPQCCESSSFLSGKGLCLIGGAALGAAAGAATGYAASSDGHRGHHGERGRRGPTGDPGATGATGAAFAFPADIGQSLTFNFVLTVTAGDVSTTVTPFVSLPDGTVIEGGAQAVVIGVNTLTPIVITDPLFGTYTSGVQVVSGFVALGATLLETVVASRDGSTTLIANTTPVVATAANESQTTVDFVYGANPVP